MDLGGSEIGSFSERLPAVNEGQPLGDTGPPGRDTQKADAVRDVDARRARFADSSVCSSQAFTCHRLSFPSTNVP